MLGSMHHLYSGNAYSGTVHFLFCTAQCVNLIRDVQKEAIRILASSTGSDGEKSAFLSHLPPKKFPV